MRDAAASGDASDPDAHTFVDPDASAPPSDLSGLWSGLSSQGRLVTFRVFSDAITNLAFNARHVVCGDHRIDWPETCDSLATTDDGSCTPTRQLAPVEETEPNDGIASSGEPVSTDVIYAASFSDGSDEDVFAIRNPYPGAIAVRLETHGGTIGTCHTNGKVVDTAITLTDAANHILASDNDGSCRSNLPRCRQNRLGHAVSR